MRAQRRPLPTRTGWVRVPLLLFEDLTRVVAYREIDVERPHVGFLPHGPPGRRRRPAGDDDGQENLGPPDSDADDEDDDE